MPGNHSFSPLKFAADMPFFSFFFLLQSQQSYSWSRTWLPTPPHPWAAGVPTSFQGATRVLPREDCPIWRRTRGPPADAGQVQSHHRRPGEAQRGGVCDAVFRYTRVCFNCSSLQPGCLLSISCSGKYDSARERLQSCKTLWVTCRSTSSKRGNSLFGFMQKMTD